MARHTLSFLGGSLLLALLYLLVGLLVSQSGYHDQVFPLGVLTGLALALVVHYGKRLLPGVWLGSLVFHLGQLANWPLHDLDAEVFSAALVIASAAVLQIWIAQQLIEKITGSPLTVKGEGQVARFILYIAFGSTLVAAILSTLGIHLLAPEAGNHDFITHWLISWLGNTFGVLLVTPLLLALLQNKKLQAKKNATNQSLHKRLVGLFAAALVIILAANHLYLTQVDTQLERTFARDAELFHANLHRLYQQNLADLSKLENHFMHNQGMDSKTFHDITAEIFQHNHSIKAYSWDPIIFPEEREAFNYETQQELNRPDYAIYGDSPNPSDPLIPVQYVEPLEENTAALGFNLFSLEDRRRWVIQSQESGRPLATEILRLTQAPDEPGFLILQPVYLNIKEESEDLLSTEKRLAGFMVGVFTVDRIIAAALRLSDLQGVGVSLSEQGEATPFYTTGDPTGNRQDASTPLYTQAFGFHFAQQQWDLQLQAGQAYKALTPGASILQFQSLLVVISALVAGAILGTYSRETLLAYRVKEQTRRLEFQAEHDPLTGLPNRLRLEQDLDRFYHAQDAQKVALMFIGLDRFKLINDSLGHLMGDSLLIELSARWLEEFGHQGHLYRMGGDEFMLLLQLKPEQQKEAALAAAQQLLKVTALPLQTAGMHLQITASVGINFSEGQEKEGTHSLISGADTALHQAKLLGKNRVEVYQSSQTDLTRRHFELEQDLRQAINSSQLVLYYQPQYRLDDLHLCGLEALVRWEHPTQGRIPPDHFIPLAEETQLIIPLGWQILDQACRQLSDWQEEGLNPPCVAVNISPQQLLQSDFIDQLNILVDAYNLSRDQLELEITETLLHQDPDFAFHQLKSLRLAGYRLALDDFGTGYSSFDRLKYMPLDRLKIDRSFVRDIGKNPKDEAIILTIIGLGKSLEIEVLAEGVETSEQQDFLTRHGCNSIQGYLHGRPQPSSELSLQRA